MDDEGVSALVGSAVDEAVARVREAGRVERVVGPDDLVTMEYRPDRVTLVAEEGRVVRATVG